MCVRKNNATSSNSEGPDTRHARPARFEHGCLIEELKHDQNTEWLWEGKQCAVRNSKQ
jgi:hypothetical protein